MHTVKFLEFSYWTRRKRIPNHIGYLLIVAALEGNVKLGWPKGLTVILCGEEDPVEVLHSLEPSPVIVTREESCALHSRVL